MTPIAVLWQCDACGVITTMIPTEEPPDMCPTCGDQKIVPVEINETDLVN